MATKNTTFHLWYKNGIVWVEKADGTVVDCVVYKTTAETGWITSANALDKLTLAVKHAQWKSTSKDDAFDLANQAIAFAKLDPAKVTAKADGNAAADWVRDETATILKLTEQKTDKVWVKVTGTTGNEVTFSVKPIVAVGSPAVSTVKADLSSFGGSATQTLYDDATNGDATSGDGVFSYKHTFAPAAVTEEYKSVIFFATSTADRPVVPVKTGFFLSPGDPTSLPLFTNADFESNPATSTQHAAITFEDTTGHDGNPTRALHFAGNLASNGNTFLTAENCYAKSIGSFTKVTFWIRTSAATIPKQLCMEFGLQQ